jgi:hypothetical protein
VKGWCHSQKGNEIYSSQIGDNGPPEAAVKEYREAAAYYLEAASKYSDDDELHVCTWNTPPTGHLVRLTIVFRCLDRELPIGTQSILELWGFFAYDSEPH